MSKIDELIKEMCPNGVEYKELGEICDIHKGIQFNKKDMNDEGSYPVINGGVNPSGYIEQYNYDENSITISQGGASAGYVNFITTKFWLGAHCYCLIPYEKILNRFLYHFVKSKEYKLQECQYGAGIPALAKGTIASLQIPIPPLPIQREIVRILDSFTELTEELTKELTKRNKQYEYYRDYLLKVNSDEVNDLVFSDIAKIKNGKDYKHLNEGNYPVYGSGGVMTYVNEYVYDKPSVLIPRKGSLNNLFYVDKPFWNVDTIFYTEINENLVIPKYLYYLLKKVHLESLNTAGGVPSLTQSTLNKIKLQIPSLNTQKKIVKCLDNFDSICSDLKIGLPAEIEARQKQYEYYRDILLTFAEKGEIIPDRQTDKQ